MASVNGGNKDTGKLLSNPPQPEKLHKGGDKLKEERESGQDLSVGEDFPEKEQSEHRTLFDTQGGKYGWAVPGQETPELRPNHQGFETSRFSLVCRPREPFKNVNAEREVRCSDLHLIIQIFQQGDLSDKG